jgi:hypothetical protein
MPSQKKSCSKLKKISQTSKKTMVPTPIVEIKWMMITPQNSTTANSYPNHQTNPITIPNPAQHTTSNPLHQSNPAKILNNTSTHSIHISINLNHKLL